MKFRVGRYELVRFRDRRIAVVVREPSRTMLPVRLWPGDTMTLQAGHEPDALPIMRVEYDGETVTLVPLSPWQGADAATLMRWVEHIDRETKPL